MKKRLLSLLLVLAVVLPLAACASDAPFDDSIVLTDQAGRTVNLDSPAETVVSGYYISTYVLISLGLTDRIVGLEKKADTRPIYHMAAPQLLELPQLGTMKELNVEAVAALDPDLVILPKKLADYADTLADLGIQTILVNPEDHDALCDMLRLIGNACGVSARAEELISYYGEKLDEIAAYTADAAKPTVYMGANSSYLSTAPSAMYQGSLIETAGGVNAAASLEGNYWTEISYETLLAMNPDVIVIPAGADYTADDMRADSQLSAVSAVKNGKIYTMPDAFEEWDSPIPSGILGMLWLTSVLHEDVYSLDDFCADAAAFYQEFYDLAIDTALITK